MKQNEGVPFMVRPCFAVYLSESSSLMYSMISPT